MMLSLWPPHPKGLVVKLGSLATMSGKIVPTAPQSLGLGHDVESDLWPPGVKEQTHALVLTGCAQGFDPLRQLRRPVG